MNFFNVKEGKSIDSAEVFINGEITSDADFVKDYLEESYTSIKKIDDEINKIKDKKVINFYINSPGGDVFAAHTIYLRLKRLKGHKNFYIDGFVASAATIILMAGDTIYMPSNAMLMIHDPLVGLQGMYNSEDLNKYSNVLDKIKDSILNSYLSRAKVDEAELTNLMSNETWLNAEESAKLGFVDVVLYRKKVEVVENKKFIIVNKVKFTNFNNKEISELINEIKNPIIQNEDIAKQERDRLKEIDEISYNIDPELVNKAKYEECWTAEKLVLEALKQGKLNNMNLFEEHVNANKDSGVDNVGIIDTNIMTNGAFEVKDDEDVSDVFGFISNLMERKEFE